MVQSVAKEKWVHRQNGMMESMQGWVHYLFFSTLMGFIIIVHPNNSFCSILSTRNTRWYLLTSMSWHQLCGFVWFFLCTPKKNRALHLKVASYVGFLVIAIDHHITTSWCPRSIAKLVNITPIARTYVHGFIKQLIMIAINISITYIMMITPYIWRGTTLYDHGMTIHDIWPSEEAFAVGFAALTDLSPDSARGWRPVAQMAGIKGLWDVKSPMNDGKYGENTWEHMGKTLENHGKI